MELDAFLRAAKENGATDEFLVAMLKDQGWPASAVYAALGRYYAEATGIPVPAARGRLESAREAFFHLLAFATLGTWIVATGSLWFELIDLWFPDALDSSYRYWGWSRISWQMASLIVAFPAFVYSTRAVLRDMAENPDKAESAVRRWLTNIALLITALIFIGDLMSFVNAFLQGGLTTRFVLHSATVFVLAGAVFLYYSRGAGKSGLPSRQWHRGFALAALAAILLSLGLGFVQTGSPTDQRALAEDQRRVRDLRDLAQALRMQWLRQSLADRRIPTSLAEAKLNLDVSRVDPITGADYQYSPGQGSAYKLCATFSKPSPNPKGAAPVRFWQHPAGLFCYDLDASIEPEMTLPY